MLRPHFLAIALLATVAVADQTSDPADPPDCSIYSIEGVRVGMTLAEAKAAIPGGELSKRDIGVVKQDKGKVWCLKRKENKKTGTPRVFMLIQTEGDKIVQLTNSYIDYDSKALSVETKFAVAPEQLVGVLSERFGSPTSDVTAQEKAEQRGIALGQDTGEKKKRAAQTRTVQWDRPECDRIVVLETGTRLYTPGALMSALVTDEKSLSPVLEVTIAEKRWRDMRLDNAVAQKVRF